MEAQHRDCVKEGAELAIFSKEALILKHVVQNLVDFLSNFRVSADQQDLDIS